MDFEYQREYSQLLSGAHRKPAALVGSPSLVGHLALWLPTSPRDRGREHDFDTDRASWNYVLNDYLRAIYVLIREISSSDDSHIKGFDSPNTDTGNFGTAKYLFLFDHAIRLEDSELIPADDLPPNLNRHFVHDYQAIVFSFQWHNALATIRFERHYEYLTITTFLDLSFRPSFRNSNPLGSLHSELPNDPVYKTLLDDFQKLATLLDSKTATIDDAERETLRKSYAQLHRHFYGNIWEVFARETLCSKRILTTSPVRNDSVAAYLPRIGSIFADFRGLVLQSNEDENTFFRLPGWRKTSRHNFAKAKAFMDDEVANRLQAFWPFLTCLDRPNLKTYEFTASRMLNNRAIYVTALGVQPSMFLGDVKSGSPDLAPVYYVLFASTSSRWQVGRLIDRIHHLGTVRIAAIQELPPLRTASRNLRKLSQAVDLAVANIRIPAPTISPPVPPASTPVGSPPSQLSLSIGRDSEVERAFTSIAGVQSSVATLNDAFIGGLMYRIERSRYYVKQFRDGLGALRIKRIEGFQPYDFFVERRLGATFDFIDRLGRRYERLENHLRLAYQYFLANGTVRHTRRIARIQGMAELLFYLFPAPYYSIGIIEHIVAAATGPMHAADRAAEPHYFMMAFFALIWVISVVFGVRRYRQLVHEDFD